MEKILTFSFCESFIDDFINYLDENYIKQGKELSRLAIVFPGKRPSLFVKKELAKRLKKDFYPPGFFTIDEFICEIVKRKETLNRADDLDSCYLLYSLAKEKAKDVLKGRENFSKFLPWTREILGFIDQLDIEKIENKALENIKANAQIGYDVPEDINRLLQNIIILRDAYHKKLQENKLYSRGLQYLKAAESINEIDFKEYDQIIFCNFFYFNRCEEDIIKDLYEKGKATLIFQGDERKWPILERISKNFNTELKEQIREGSQVTGHKSQGGMLPTPQFNLDLYSGFDVHSQMSLVREILKRIKDKDKTVIVLPEPDHIVPLLSEITSVIDDFNVSMGYPLKRSSLYSLFDFVFRAQLSKKDNKYYARDYLKALRHPFIKNLRIKNDPAVTRILVHKIEEILTGKERTELSGSLFLDLDDIEQLDDIFSLSLEMCRRLNIDVKKSDLIFALQEIHRIVFRSWEAVSNFEDFSNALEGFLNCLIQESHIKNYPLNLNIINNIFMIKEEFRNASFKRESFDKEEIFKVFDEKISQERIAFIGSPLKGLQILGLFETRSLNFENVIIVDVNEGSLPKLNIYEPLIPREVMISLDLDRLELEEEIQRYQFMRLISSAKNVHLVYQENREKEKSRFVEELIWGKQKKADKFIPVSVNRANFEVKVQDNKKEIKKTPEIIEALKKITFSASSLSMYLRDPMEFYYSYVLGLKETEDLLDEPDARQIGTFVHELLEEAFKPYVNKPFNIDSFFKQRFFELFEKNFNRTFDKSMKSDSFLLRSVLNERLARFLEKESDSDGRAIEKILFLEKRFEEVMPLSCGDIKFGYVVDRIDEMRDGTIMLLDYKTGSVDVMPKSFDIISRMSLSRENIRDNVKSFQVPLYFHYLQKEFKGKNINAALYSLRTLKINKFIDSRVKVDVVELNKVFLKCLDFIISEILDIKVPFVEDNSDVRRKSK